MRMYVAVPAASSVRMYVAAFVRMYAEALPSSPFTAVLSSPALRFAVIAVAVACFLVDERKLHTFMQKKCDKNT